MYPSSDGQCCSPPITMMTSRTFFSCFRMCPLYNCIHADGLVRTCFLVVVYVLYVFRMRSSRDNKFYRSSITTMVLPTYFSCRRTCPLHTHTDKLVRTRPLCAFYGFPTFLSRDDNSCRSSITTMVSPTYFSAFLTYLHPDEAPTEGH